jgi:hypothetical protein
VAADSKMSAARGGEKGALEEYMFYGLEGLATLASYLFWGVLREEPLCVLSGEGVSCDKAVKS